MAIHSGLAFQQARSCPLRRGSELLPSVPERTDRRFPSALQQPDRATSLQQCCDSRQPRDQAGPLALPGGLLVMSRRHQNRHAECDA